MTKSIIITGAGSGIGRAAAHAFIEAGWLVGLIGRRSASLEETANEHKNALILPCDVGEADAVEQAFDNAKAAWGRLDTLFNNAGIFNAAKPIDEISVDEWTSALAVNLTGSFLCARAAFAMMRAQSPQGGRIINNGSISAHTPRPGSTCYTTTKHAITGLTKTLSLDGRAFDIVSSQIDIGNALTEMAMPMTKGVSQADGSIKAEATMDVAHVGRAVLQMAELPLDANIQFMTIMAPKMPFIGRG